MLLKSNPEYRRYTMALVGLMGSYVGTLIGVTLFFQNGPPTGVSAYAAAILPALPIIGVFFVMARLLVTLKDEYQRFLLTRQMLIATGFMLSLATIWGFVESFGLLPHVPAYYAAVLWFGGLGVGTCINKMLDAREAV